MPNRLTPTWIFIDEMTRINQLYWNTSYAYTRVERLLATMAPTITDDPDPRVSAIWPSKVDGEHRHTTRRLSEFSGALVSNLDALRSTSLLYLCSAFENALSGFYVLCGLYRPTSILPRWSHGAVPALLRDPVRYAEIKRKAYDLAGANVKTSVLKGKYSKRIALLDATFGLHLPTLPSAQLDAYYDERHRIAHDQGLVRADDPDSSPAEVVSRRVSLTEQQWKSVSKDFNDTVVAMDGAVQAHVVRDHCLSIAVNHILNRDGSMTVGQLRASVNKERHLEVDYAAVEQAATGLGRNISKERRIFRRLVS